MLIGFDGSLDDLGLEIDRIVKFQAQERWWFRIYLRGGAVVYCGDAASLNSFTKVDAKLADAVPGGMLPPELKKDWRYYAALIGAAAVEGG